MPGPQFTELALLCASFNDIANQSAIRFKESLINNFGILFSFLFAPRLCLFACQKSITICLPTNPNSCDAFCCDKSGRPNGISEIFHRRGAPPAEAQLLPWPRSANGRGHDDGGSTEPGRLGCDDGPDVSAILGDAAPATFSQCTTVQCSCLTM